MKVINLLLILLIIFLIKSSKKERFSDDFNDLMEFQSGGNVFVGYQPGDNYLEKYVTDYDMDEIFKNEIDFKLDEKQNLQNLITEVREIMVY